MRRLFLVAVFLEVGFLLVVIPWLGFWDRWWHPGDSAVEARDDRGVRVSRIQGAVPRDELQRAIDEVRPGEEVRIPVVNEEIVVERRPVADPPPRR